MKYFGINIDVQEIYTEVYTKLLRDINGLEDNITKMLALSVDSIAPHPHQTFILSFFFLTCRHSGRYVVVTD